MGQSIDTKEIARVERGAEAGWPALETATLGPWRCRASQGVTSRANSVMTTPALHADARADWSQLIEWAEAFYRRQALAPTFQISASTVPSNLDEMLADRGYEVEKMSEVHQAHVAALIRQPPELGSAFVERRSHEPDEAWLTLEFGDPSARRAIQERICRQITVPQLFASIQREGQTVACARGVMADGLGWVYNMATAPAWRRRGLAAYLLHRLARWCGSLGVGQMYLQVMAQNAPAIALYQRAGFSINHRYHYTVLR
jgi:GNAT superfamily N-acetyltransferase